MTREGFTFVSGSATRDRRAGGSNGQIGVFGSGDVALGSAATLNFGMGGDWLSQSEGQLTERVIATDLKNPDFVMYAQAFGAFAIRCETTGDFPAALEAARAATRGPDGRPALLHLITSAEDIAPGRTITGLRGG